MSISATTETPPPAAVPFGFCRIGSGPPLAWNLSAWLDTRRDPEAHYADMRNLNSKGLEALMHAAQAGDMRACERLLKEITPRLRPVLCGWTAGCSWIGRL